MARFLKNLVEYKIHKNNRLKRDYKLNGFKNCCFKRVNLKIGPGPNVSKMYYTQITRGEFFLLNWVPLIGYYVSKVGIFSVTRLGDLLDFGQLFKALGNN